MNIILNIKTSFIILVIFLSSGCGRPNIKQQKVELDLTISIHQDTFSIKAPIQCTFRLSNQSDISIGIKNGLNLGFLDDSDSNLNLLIEKNGTSIITAKDIHYAFIKSDSITFIKKGAFLERSFDISPFYPLKESGNYSIQAQFLDTFFVKNTAYNLLDIKSNHKKVFVQ